MKPAPITMYGIPNCDTVKRARAWLAEHQEPITFHDYKAQGVPLDQLRTWLQTFDWAVLVNTRGTTWRRLNEAVRASVVDADSALRLMQAQPSVIKRPVVVWADGQVTVGFDAADWQRRLTLES